MAQSLITLKIVSIAPNRAPMHLLLEADPSVEKVKRYLQKSHCFIAKIGAEVIGVYVLQPITEDRLELMNIAVDPKRQGQGIGKQLLEHAITSAKQLNARRLELGTGTFGYQLAFYQRAGFRVDSIDKDFFLKNYAAPIFEMGIQHKDMLRLAIDL